MKYKKLVLLGLLVFSLLFAFLFYKTNKSVVSPTPTPTQTVEQQISAKQIINYGTYKQEEDKEVEISGNETALDILEKTEQVETKEYSFGKLVEDINGIKNGTDNKYWIYYINGNESKIGASDYKVQKGDEIEWRFKAYEK